jgi:desampylase
VAAAPQEACGLLFGHEGRIVEASVARNIAAEPRHRFEIDPAHLFEAHRRARAGPLALIGCWHSHPNGQPAPSKHDADGVSDRTWVWLIAAGEIIAAWQPAAEGFQPVALVERGL